MYFRHVYDGAVLTNGEVVAINNRMIDICKSLDICGSEDHKTILVLEKEIDE